MSAPKQRESAGDRPDGTEPEANTELRLGLVCYGGVSLAIYMHGVTKELHKLVNASRRFDDDPTGANPFHASTETEYAYFEVLRELAGERHPVSVSIDVIAGTSAGGINGVCLAKVLARNGSQDALKKLWIEEGDLNKLLRGPAIGGWRTHAALTVLRMLGHLKDPVAPLRGDHMSQLLYDAIHEMDAPVGARRSLLSRGGALDLYVTTTDLNGFPVLVPTGAGGSSQQETNHAQVVGFQSDGDESGDFGLDGVGALTFAARATSCFPGAFPPVSLESFKKELTEHQPVDTSVIAQRFQKHYEAQAKTSDDAWFIDGGVLDNAPFDLVVQAIGGKRAESEVVRHVIYIQPDPGVLPGSVPDGPAQNEAPGYLSALLKGVLSVKGSHSILPELLTLRDLNLRIAELGALTRLQMNQVMGVMAQTWSDHASTMRQDAPQQVWDITELADVKLLADAFYKKGETFVGAGFPAYCQLKVEDVARGLAGRLAHGLGFSAESSHASFVRAALTSWARRRMSADALDSHQLLALLGPVDTPYRERRLLFILAGINQFYAKAGQPGQPARADLDQLKSQAWDLLVGLRAATHDAVTALLDSDVSRFLTDSELSEQDVFGSPDVFAVEHDEAFAALYTAYRTSLEAQVTDSSTPMWEAFVARTAAWDPAHKQALLSRYLGFPLWDSLLFPTIALADLPQFTPIAVTQFSPLAAAALQPEGGKLKGVGLHHFAAFEDAAWRENDYLWGRLDAVELILRTLRGTLTPGAFTPTPANRADATDAAVTQAGPQLRRGLAAVLTSEQDLKRLGKLPAELEALVAELPTSPPADQVLDLSPGASVSSGR